MRAPPRRAGRNTFTKRVSDEQVTASLTEKLDALSRRLRREAEARGEPWPPPPWEQAYAAGVDFDAPDTIEHEDAPEAAPSADPHAAAVQLLGQWHVPPERDA